MAKTTTPPVRLKQMYRDDVRSQLMKDLDIDNIHVVPEIEKIVVSVGLGKAQGNKRIFEAAENTLRKITGQQPITTKARKSIASFKLREGMDVGMKVTLRGDYMYDFLDRLMNIVLPRVRDFRGVPLSSLDKSGNYSLGLKEQSVFPELSYEETSTPHGIEVTIVTSTNNKEHSRALLAALGMPFEKENA